VRVRGLRAKGTGRSAPADPAPLRRDAHHIVNEPRRVPVRPQIERGRPLREQGNDMTKLNNEICDPSIEELSIEEMDAVTGGDSAILQLAKLAGAAAVYAGGGHFGNIATTLP